MLRTLPSQHIGDSSAINGSHLLHSRRPLRNRGQAYHVEKPTRRRKLSSLVQSREHFSSTEPSLSSTGCLSRTVDFSLCRSNARLSNNFASEDKHTITPFPSVSAKWTICSSINRKISRCLISNKTDVFSALSIPLRQSGQCIFFPDSCSLTVNRRLVITTFSILRLISIDLGFNSNLTSGKINP